MTTTIPLHPNGPPDESADGHPDLRRFEVGPFRWGIKPTRVVGSFR